LLDDFALDLPDSIKKNQEKIKEISSKLQAATNRQDILELITGLIKVIKEFINNIETNSNRLIKETQKLKSNKEGVSYPENVKKATHLVEFYIIPVNQLFDNHSESVISLLGNIKLWVHQKMNTATDNNIQIQFRNLYEHINYIQDDLMNYSRVLTKELLPLLERIKTESELLSGFLEFLKKPKAFNVPKLLKGSRYTATSTSFKEDTLFLMEALREEKVSPILAEDVILDTWFFKKEKYMERIRISLPIQNFSEFCYYLIEDIEQEITLEQFYTVQSLLLETEFEANFSSQRIELAIENYIIETPTIELYAIS
jgi:hypothetical protein